MQKSSMPPAFADLRLGDGTDMYFHSVAHAKEPNWLVESVTAPGRIYDPKKVRVQAVIAGIGTEAATRNVSLVLDNKVLRNQEGQRARQRSRHRRIPEDGSALRVPQAARSASNRTTLCAKTTAFPSR